MATRSGRNNFQDCFCASVSLLDGSCCRPGGTEHFIATESYKSPLPFAEELAGTQLMCRSGSITLLMMEGGNKTKRGELLPEIALPSVEGRKVRLSDYRGRSNLMVILAAEKDDEKLLPLLMGAARKHSDVAGEETEVIVILSNDSGGRVPSGVRADWPFVFLTDIDGHAHRLFNAIDDKGGAVSAVFIADRYGEIYTEYRAGGQDEIPGIDEVLQWLFFINSQCPECGVSEWPQ